MRTRCGRSPPAVCGTEERLAEFLAPAARRGGLWVPGRLRSAAADEPVKFASAGQGEPIQGYLTQAEGSGPLPGRRSPAHLPRPAGRARFDRRAGRGLGLCRPVRRRLCDARPQGDLRRRLQASPGRRLWRSRLSRRLPYVDPRRIAAVGFSQGGDTALKIASRRARPASRRRRLSMLLAPTWRARRSTSRRSSSSARRTR